MCNGGVEMYGVYRLAALLAFAPAMGTYAMSCGGDVGPVQANGVACFLFTGAIFAGGVRCTSSWAWGGSKGKQIASETGVARHTNCHFSQTAIHIHHSLEKLCTAWVKKRWCSYPNTLKKQDLLGFVHGGFVTC
jgi:hypothetical protein